MRSRKETLNIRFLLEAHTSIADKLKRKQVLTEILSPPVLEKLSEGRWGIALAIDDTDKVLTKQVQQINRDYPNIPLSCWILPMGEEYWTAKTNILETEAKVDRILNWIDKNNLHFDRIGFDLEFPKPIFEALLPKFQVEKFLKAFLKFRTKEEELRKRGINPDLRFAELVSKLAATSGMVVETYEFFSPILDSPFLGAIQYTGNLAEKFTMVYSSFLPKKLRESKQFMMTLLKQGTSPAIGVFLGKGESFPLKDETTPDKRRRLTQDIQTFLTQSTKSLYIYALDGVEIVNLVDKAFKKV